MCEGHSVVSVDEELLLKRSLTAGMCAVPLGKYSSLLDVQLTLKELI